ncbi:hypothetical protein Y032_0033g2723 [Ancylostoma ceylanicum]|nr:hypothetical protein Y032_0033g2723 [Ancylostoma ceylanicum]
MLWSELEKDLDGKDQDQTVLTKQVVSVHNCPQMTYGSTHNNVMERRVCHATEEVKHYVTYRREGLSPHSTVQTRPSSVAAATKPPSSDPPGFACLPCSIESFYLSIRFG